MAGKTLSGVAAAVDVRRSEPWPCSTGSCAPAKTRILRKLDVIAHQVNDLEEHYVDLPDDELRAQTDEFKQRYAEGESLDDLMVEAFAVVREASRRTLGQRHFDVQLMGGAALHLGNIAEMRTGEGKTLTGVLAGVPQRPGGQGRPRRHDQRLPRQARRRVDGSGAPLPRPDASA